VVALRLAQGSREATPSNSKEALSGVAIHSTKDVAKGGKKRCKQHPQGAMATTDHDDGNCKKAGSSGKGLVATTAHGDKHQGMPHIDHFRILLEKACPNHLYPIRHKLKDCGMMKSFMILGSFTRGLELDEDLSGSYTMPFS
jgi:hypothetical protein